MKGLLFIVIVFIPAITFAQWQPLGPVVSTPFKGFSEGQAAYTSVAIDSNNTPYLVYQDAAYAKRTTVKKYNGSKWVTVGRAGFSAGAATNCCILIDKTGAPCVLYRDAANGNKATVMHYTDTGWALVGTPGFTANPAEYTDMAMDSSGALYVVSSDYSNLAVVMKFDGSVWAPVGNAGLPSYGASYTRIAISKSGVPYITYHDELANRSITVQKFDGTNWVNVGLRGFSGAAAYFTTIALDSSGTPYVAFTDHTIPFKLSVKKYTGSSWINVGPQGFSPGPGQAGNITLAFDSKDSLYVAYNDVKGNVTASGFTSVMKFRGGNWIYIGQQKFSVSRTNYAAMAIDKNDIPLVVYTDDAIDNKVASMKFDGTDWVPVGGTTNYTHAVSPYAIGNAQFSVSKSGRLFVAYKDASLGQKITVKYYEGNNWVTLGNPGFSDTAALNLSLALSPEGNPVVAYIETGGGFTVKRYYNNEWTVLGSRKISMPAEYEGVKLGIGSNGDTYVIYSDDSVGGRPSIRRYTANGWEFVGSPGINRTVGSCADQKIAVTSTGVPYIMYVDETDYTTTLLKYNFTGQFWSNVGGSRISNAVLLNGSCLVLDSAANPVIAYGQPATGGYKLVTRKFDGTQWINLGSDTGTVGATTSATSISLALDSAGTPYIACSDFGAVSKATVRKHTDSGWILLGDRGFTTGGAGFNTIALDSAATPYLLYADYNDSSKVAVMKYTRCNSPNTWIGTINTSWEDPRNWSCGLLPDSSTDVVLNAGAVVVLNSKAAIRSLTVNGTVNFNITSDSHLTVLH